MRTTGVAIALVVLGLILAFVPLVAIKTSAVGGYITIDGYFFFLLLLMVVGAFLCVVGVGRLGARKGIRW